jgi:hypothetical protein
MPRGAQTAHHVNGELTLGHGNSVKRGRREGKREMKNEECRMKNEECGMRNEECRMQNEECRRRSGGIAIVNANYANGANDAHKVKTQEYSRVSPFSRRSR